MPRRHRQPRQAIPPKGAPDHPFWLRWDVTDVSGTSVRSLYNGSMSHDTKAELYLATAKMFVQAARAEIERLERLKRSRPRRRRA